ncbi:MAG: hypothetical protein M5R36_05090 [Deltaproteobacteria bacterium]|nr:hypothetical protein [Deltaproteobacteria bacterium]
MWVDGGTKATATQKKRLAAAFGVTIAYLLLRTVVLGQVERAEGIAPPALETRLLTMSTVIWHEAAKLVFPFALRPAYWVAPRTAVDAAAVLGFAGIAAILVWILARRSTGRPAVFGVLWFFVALLPFSNVIALDTFMAERYLYSALGGVAIVVAASLDATSVLDPAHPRRRRLAAAIFGVIFFSMAAFTAHRAHVWSNETRLWRDAFRKDNKALLVLVNLANEIKLHEIGEDPCPYFERAQIYNTDAFEIFPGLGECAVRRGDLEGATVYFKNRWNRTGAERAGSKGSARFT